MKTVFWGNYKGGVGKTTSVYQVAGHFAMKGKKVLLIDLDPQCSLSNICSSTSSRHLDAVPAERTFNYVVELYMRYINNTPLVDFFLMTEEFDELVQRIDMYVKDSIQKVNIKKSDNLYFIPSSLSYENSRLNELAQRMNKNINNLFLIKLFIDSVKKLDEFEYIFFDCPPTSNLLTQSVFLSSDYYIVPTICDEVSTKGVPDYITEIEKTYNRFGMHEQIGGIMVSKVFGSKPKFLGVFETIYKERRGNADNSHEIGYLDATITQLRIPSVLSQKVYAKYRYQVSHGDDLNTTHIFKDYIAHKDNRSGGESIPQNTARGDITPAYEQISGVLFNMLGG
ncbi:AAA family ATPase [Lysinibacillus macroides]|uniref:ParA family protein n=1 Tax=Lysinibacillus macroides TaxID=33935 RepID=UPI0019350A66|nr:AAA family ATPase [Lysinibacillus macroides]